ncbi:hypothetical protein ONZ45_g16121 [Pleurotus djamor]|nr:hypothetical protein ONZ45_g16121 [Pleurotus djamor]
MPASPSLHLPPELLVLIAERTFDRATLHAGSLVRRSWTWAFQKSLFNRSCVSLCTAPRPHGRDTPATQFLMLLYQSPSLGSYVRGLEIPFCDCPRHRYGDLEVLAAVLTYTDQLNLLKLNGRLPGLRRASFDVSFSFLEALRATIRRPSFAHLIIENMTFNNASLIPLWGNPLPSLKRFHLNEVHFDDDFRHLIAGFSNNIPNALPHVESFQSSVDLADLFKVFGPFSIKSLSMKWYRQHFDAVIAHEYVTSNLEELLNVSGCLVDLNRFPRLKTLSFQDFNASLSKGIAFPRDHESHCIETISICIWGPDGLHSLDQLSRSDRFPSFKVLKVTPGHWSSNDPTSSVLTRTIHESLPRLSARGLIDFDDSQFSQYIVNMNGQPQIPLAVNHVPKKRSWVMILVVAILVGSLAMGVFVAVEVAGRPVRYATRTYRGLRN